MKLKIERVWITLVILSIFAFLVGRFELISNVFIIILGFSTFIKGFLVIDHFMDLKEVRLFYRMIPILWLLWVLLLVGLAYYL